MGNLVQTNLSLIETANRTNDNGVIAIAETLSETQEMQDIVFLPANKKDIMEVTRRSSLPSGALRTVNAGVPNESSTTTKILEGISMLESFSVVDEFLANNSGDVNGYRADEANAFIEGMGQTFGDKLFYGTLAGSPADMDGLATRRTDASSAQFIEGGGTGSDLTSLYIVNWSPRGIHMFFPEGSQAGLSVNDLGLKKEVDPNDSTKSYMAYTEHFAWLYGLAEWDPRSYIRYGNIESSGSSNIFNDSLLLTALNRLRGPKGGNVVIYANETIKTQMDIDAKDKSNVAYTTAEDAFGATVTRFRGAVVRQSDSIIDTETEVT